MKFTSAVVALAAFTGLAAATPAPTAAPRAMSYEHKARDSSSTVNEVLTVTGCGVINGTISLGSCPATKTTMITVSKALPKNSGFFISIGDVKSTLTLTETLTQTACGISVQGTQLPACPSSSTAIYTQVVKVGAAPAALAGPGLALLGSAVLAVVAGQLL
ncbi:hypothetical protein OC846_000286 [Tilletia horrida]|uniref:Phosphatidylglycerol/phosphatidylinositol transfer protein n=1 Tax=Tilletia horrida TaxID=155126 RepID=A0AAN6H142_9BASI|nr:hypothetical protein OC845_002974 [Tilletia horrida]KAK0557719.1 hypothetical protein OC846_000286 [Tilletia horrida]KAK0570306.1 hypothetical protein OC861_000049 [Tilletia horrida]